MGYTHYFAHKKTSKENWGKILTDCNALRDHLPKDVKIAGWDGSGDPVFSDDEIRFNGVDGNAHETFSLVRQGMPVRTSYDKDNGMGFAFCKTARKPYDLLVCACLLVYKHYSPDTMQLGSDGCVEEWVESMKFVEEVLGYEVCFDESEGDE